MKKMRFDDSMELREVEFGDGVALVQRQGNWFCYWAEQPEPNELADEVRCAECGEEPESCQCEEINI